MNKTVAEEKFGLAKAGPMPARAAFPDRSEHPPSEAAETVILVHGLWMTGLELQWLALGLRRHGFRVRTFRYPSIRVDLTQNARRLARFHERIVSGGDAPGKTHLVAHSLGGLVIAQMLRDDPARLAETGRVVALGTPFLGSASAKVLTGFPLGSRIVGCCFPEEKEAARLPVVLPCKTWDFPVELGVIAGSFSFGVGRLIGAFSTPNDGVVGVEETRLPGASAHLTLPVNHVAMTFSHRVIGETCHFLRHGRFERTAAA